MHPNGEVTYVNSVTEPTKRTTTEPAYNPRQRYVCPDCEYAWTDRPAAKWESGAAAFAGNVLVVCVVLAGLFAVKWPFWAVMSAAAVTYGVLFVVEEIRSAVEDWLDPADTTYRAV